MGKTTVVYVTFLRDVARQKLLNSVNVSRSYSQNNTGTVFLRHGVVAYNKWKHQYAQYAHTYAQHFPSEADIYSPIQYEHAPLGVRCAMLRKHPPVDPVLSCPSCFRKPSVGVCQVVSNSPDPGIAWPSARFRPDL